MSPNVVSEVCSFSVCVGDPARPRCDATCPMCCSKMSSAGTNDEPTHGVKDIDAINLSHACSLARNGRCQSVVLTGKGEPTIDRDEVEWYLERLQPYDFPTVDLQTNGISLYRDLVALPEDHAARRAALVWLYRLRDLGLTTVAISLVHWDPILNATVYQAKERRDQFVVRHGQLVGMLAKLGFTVRLSCVMMKGFVDRFSAVGTLVWHAKQWGARQVTVRPVGMPSVVRDPDVQAFVRSRELDPGALPQICELTKANAKYWRTLPHGARLYDLDGVSLCLSDCFPDNGDISDRPTQIIFWPNGRIGGSWQFDGFSFL